MNSRYLSVLLGAAALAVIALLVLRSTGEGEPRQSGQKDELVSDRGSGDRPRLPAEGESHGDADREPARSRRERSDEPALGELTRRDGEDEQVFRGRSMTVENYRTAVNAASLTGEEELQVRRVLADAQRNRIELERVEKEMLSTEPDNFAERMGNPVEMFNAEVDAQLLEVLGEDKHERFRQRLGSYSAFVFFRPFDLPGEVAARDFRRFNE